MTDKEKYMELLGEIGELLSSKNTTIMAQEFRISQLEEALKSAEDELAKAQCALCETVKTERKDW